MSVSLKASSDGTQAIIQVGGVDKMVVGTTGVQACIPVTSYANDTEAATAGVPIGGFYHTSGTVKVRVV